MSARAIAIALALVSVASCASEPAAVTNADSLADLQAICADTTAALDALPQPPDQITVAEFATSAASALADEAEQARSLRFPEDLDDDHRAFIRNTDEQADTWRAIATVGDDNAELGELTVRIGELIRGRNDLVDEMGAPGCRRGEV